VAELASVVRAEDAIDAAAELLAAHVVRTIETRGGARLAIPGGSTVDVASLLPGWCPSPGARVAHVTRSPLPPFDRITLTRALLDRADATLLFVTGEHKRHALDRLLSGDSQLPAHGLPGLVVVTDLHQEA
jgi:6-phosphogluconolactonase/glucosamine-6-phosphate isomerase/deaminase